MIESKNFEIKIAINDKPIPMNPFVKDVVKNVLCALIQSLKLEDQPEKIEVLLTRS